MQVRLSFRGGPLDRRTPLPDVTRHNPSDTPNLTGEGRRRQLTVSYRLLPFSGRTLVGKAPQKATAAVASPSARPWGRTPFACTANSALRQTGYPSDLTAELRQQSGSASVRLPTQECRDFKLILFVLVMHRSLPAVLIEPLRRGALGVFGDGFRAWLGRTRHGTTGKPLGWLLNVLGHPRQRRLARPCPVRGVRRPTDASRSSSDLRRPGCSSCGSSPRRARISFCAGTGSSSSRGMRGARGGNRSACGGMNSSGSCVCFPARCRLGE